MKDLLRKIYESVLVHETDIFNMEKYINNEMENYIEPLKERFSEDELDIIRDCIYTTALLSETESFKMGMKYGMKMIIEVLSE